MSRSLQFDIVANDKATGTLKGVQGAASNFAKSIGGMLTGMFALQAVVSRVSSFATESFKWATELRDIATGIGITTTELQQLEYAAKLAGVEVGKLQKGFLDLRKISRDAQGGNEKAIQIMKALGFSQAEISGGNIDVMETLIRVSGAISAATTEQEKFNIATALFGDKVAVEMIKALGDYQKFKASLADTPLISDKDLMALEKAADHIDRLTLRMKVFFAEYMAKVVENPNPTPLGQFLFGENKPATVAEPSTAQASASAAALATLSGPASAGKNAGGIAGGGGSEQFTALQQIGGAAGFRSGAGGSSPELTALEKIEENTRPGGTVPANGSTNFTNAGVTDHEYSTFVNVAQRARFGARRRDRAPR